MDLTHLSDHELESVLQYRLRDESGLPEDRADSQDEAVPEIPREDALLTYWDRRLKRGMNLEKRTVEWMIKQNFGTWAVASVAGEYAKAGKYSGEYHELMQLIPPDTWGHSQILARIEVEKLKTKDLTTLTVKEIREFIHCMSLNKASWGVLEVFSLMPLEYAPVFLNTLREGKEFPRRNRIYLIGTIESRIKISANKGNQKRIG